VIVLYTDFGSDDPYVGQVHCAIRQNGWVGPVIDLLHSAPSFDVKASAYLLAALVEELPPACVLMAVVDPGVGGERAPIMVQMQDRWLVGPDNGLLSVMLGRAEHWRCHRIDWRPPRLSNSFHGRDLFAPVAAMLAQDKLPEHTTDFSPDACEHWPDDLPQVIYIDHYGNAMTGLRAKILDVDHQVCIHGTPLPEFRNFADAPAGTPFWYCNSIGLIEIALNSGHAARKLGLQIGSAVTYK
jgi:S-adenosylmethionine hydrolase